MGLELFFSAGGKGSNAGWQAVMLDMSVEFRKGDLRIFTTAAIGAFVVLKGWL